MSGDHWRTRATTDPAALIAEVESGKMPVHDLTFAAEALGWIANGSALAPLIRLSEHASPIVREGAVYGLARLQPDQLAVAQLVHIAAHDDNSSVRESAREAME